MPSQHDYLVDDELRAELRRREPAAECRLVQRFNRGRRPQGRLTVPPPGTHYEHYNSRLLALLWALADNAAALEVLARRHGWTEPVAPAYAQMPEELLVFLWTWGRDGLALETLWTRRGWLPQHRIEATTPDALLGFLWWRQRRTEARDELFRRYHLGGATDAAQDRALTLLLVVDRWDYERYPTLEHLMNVSAAHRRIDAGRHGALAPRLGQHDAENAAAPQARPEAAVEERDYLETNVPLELRCLHKIRENSSEQPLDLTAEELDYLAGKNLSHAGCHERSGPPWARERTRILEWMAHHPQPGEAEMHACFPWFRQSGLSRQTRLWRLHWRADENNRLLTALLAGADETLSDVASLLQEHVDELVRRIASPNRVDSGDERGPVLLFAALVDAFECLRSALATRRMRNGRLDLFAAWQANGQAFLEAFPILIKLAGCHRCTFELLHAGGSPQAVHLLHRLSDWLDGGQWLATFSRDDRTQSDLFYRRIADLRDSFAGEAWSAVELLLLWLESTQTPGEPERRLLDLERVWRGSRAWPNDLASLARELPSAAGRGDWPSVAERAAVLVRRLADGSPPAAAPGREFRDCLLRLSRGR